MTTIVRGIGCSVTGVKRASAAGRGVLTVFFREVCSSRTGETVAVLFSALSSAAAGGSAARATGVCITDLFNPKSGFAAPGVAGAAGLSVRVPLKLCISC
jgi:hypothetical protein